MAATRSTATLAALCALLLLATAAPRASAARLLDAKAPERPAALAQPRHDEALVAEVTRRVLAQMDYPGASALSMLSSNNAQSAIQLAADGAMPASYAANSNAANTAMTAYGGSYALPMMAAPRAAYPGF